MKKKILFSFCFFVFCFSVFSAEVSNSELHSSTGLKKDQMAIYTDDFFKDSKIMENINSLGNESNESNESNFPDESDIKMEENTMELDSENNETKIYDEISESDDLSVTNDKANDKETLDTSDLSEIEGMHESDSNVPSASGLESENQLNGELVNKISENSNEVLGNNNEKLEETEELEVEEKKTKSLQSEDLETENIEFLETKSEDLLLLSGVPVIYGEESFKRRIEERTGGEREPIGLVLTGGSARALAHIGVLMYLEENNIVPDFIISNSMGSIIAMLYSAGLSPSQILQIFKSIDLNSLFDFTIPIGSGFMDTIRFESLVSKYLGEDIKLEELQIPVMIICEDLVSKRQIQICEGDFYTVFTASYALPVYFSSVLYKEHRLVDGGIANIAPVSVAYNYSDTVIVSTTFYNNKNINLSNPITGLNTAVDIGKRREGVKEILDHPEVIWVRCNVEDFSFMEFSSVEEMAEHGYESAKEKEEEILPLSALSDGVDNEMLKLRDQYDVIIENVFKDYLPYHYTGYRRFSYNFPVIGTNYDSIVGFNTMSGFSLGTGIKAGTGILDFNALIALNMNLVSDSFFIKPEIRFNLSRQLLNSLRFTFNFSFDFKSLLYFQANLEERILLKNFSIIFGVNGELNLCIIKDYPDPLTYLASAYIKLKPKKTDYFDFGAIAFVHHGTIYPAVALEATIISDNILKNQPIGFTSMINFRYKFKSDDNPVNLGYSVSFKAYYINKTSPTLAEIVLFNPIRAGIYVEFNGFNIPSTDYMFKCLETGLFVSTDLGIIGLNAIPMELFIGYRFLDVNGLRGGFRIPLSL